MSQAFSATLSGVTVNNPLDSNAYAGAWTQTLAGIATLEYEPQVWSEIFRQTGIGFDIMDFINIAGNVTTVRNRTTTTLEEGPWKAPVITSGDIATGSATAYIDVSLATGGYEATTNNAMLRIGESVIIPGKYMNDGISHEYRVTSNPSGSPGSYVWRCYPESATCYVSTTIPSGTYLAVGPTAFAPGTDHIGGRHDTYFSFTHYTRILKEAVEFEGGQNALRRYMEIVNKGGYKSLIDRGLFQAERRLDDQISKAILIGEANGNSLTGTSWFGNTNNVQSFNGLLPLMASRSQTLNYTTSFAIDDFNDFNPLLRSQGVVGEDVVMGVGPDLMLDIENSGLSFVEQYSKTDFMTMMEQLSVGFRVVKKNGVRTTIVPFQSFGNPADLGLPDYEFAGMGMVFPTGLVNVTQNGEKVSLGNVNLGYLNYNGEDRTRIIGNVAGINGLGYPISSTYDGVKALMLTEFALITAKLNQAILVKKATS